MWSQVQARSPDCLAMAAARNARLGMSVPNPAPGRQAQIVHKLSLRQFFRAVRFEINGDNCSVDNCSAGWQSVHYVTLPGGTVTD